MWRMQSEATLIDLINNFFIVRLHYREEYERALLDGMDDQRSFSTCAEMKIKLWSRDG